MKNANNMGRTPMWWSDRIPFANHYQRVPQICEPSLRARKLEQIVTCANLKRVGISVCRHIQLDASKEESGTEMKSYQDHKGQDHHAPLPPKTSLTALQGKKAPSISISEKEQEEGVSH